MSALLDTPAATSPERVQGPVPLLRTLVLCDLADSTALVERLGDRHAAELIRKHDRYTRALLHQHGGREIDKTDGFLVMFERPVQAVAFALDYQRSLAELNAGGASRLRARVGIHVGDVVVWDNAPDDVAKGAKPVEVEGLVKPITSRLMQLALPGQILLSGIAYQLAHRAQGELGDEAAIARWRTHGRYRFKGVPDPIAVFEVGEEGIAPLKAPPWSSKAHREVPFWRRPATLVLELGMLAAIVLIPALYLLRPEPAIAFAQRDWVVLGHLSNLTGDSNFDDAVDAAFRIGLEQSRHVNVLSDLKTRETVKLMQRDPERTRIDRAIGSEVAIRDGARALILPTVAEIGGRVRVTAEVVDPRTQTTVYSESADGVGEGSVLASLDTVGRKLRARLGEALATVSSESKPLEKVATRNLDALKAYSLAQRSYDSGNDADALALYRQAVKLDGEFALARIGLARMLVIADQRADAVAELDTASVAKDRMAARDALYVEAWQASLTGSHRDAIEKWKLLAKMYPDFFTAQGLHAYFAWEYANRYDADVIEAAKASASPQNPNAANSELLLGMLLLAGERYDDAAHQFDLARKSGLAWHSDYALPAAAQRKFDVADAVLAAPSSAGLPSAGAGARVQRIAIAVDRGDRAKARAELAAARESAAKDNPRYLRLFDAIRLSLPAGAIDAAAPPLKDHAVAVKAALAKASTFERRDNEFELLLAAYLAARQGDAKLASDLVGALGAEKLDDYPMLAKIDLVARAEIARAEGKPERAVELLKPSLDGSELYVAHATLMDAYAAAGNSAAALGEARWLAEHRGRAYAEYDFRQVLVPLNVALSNLALLRAAEIARAAGDAASAAASLRAFEQAWPAAAANEPLAARVRTLRKE